MTLVTHIQVVLFDEPHDPIPAPPPSTPCCILHIAWMVALYNFGATSCVTAEQLQSSLHRAVCIAHCERNHITTLRHLRSHPLAVLPGLSFPGLSLLLALSFPTGVLPPWKTSTFLAGLNINNTQSRHNIF